jgi:hypothetical protein
MATFRRRHRRRPVVVLRIRDLNDPFAEEISVILKPNREENLMTTLSVGHKLQLAILYLDQNGNPMVTTPVADAPPSWTNSTPTTETLVVAGDGQTAVATAVAPGSDTINLSLDVGGVAFSATLAVTVQAAPQVLSSIAIDATVV